MPTLHHFLAELQRRKVFRVAATYLVGAWIVLGVALSASCSGQIGGDPRGGSNAWKCE